MAKPELALSNTTSFFSGNIENLFKNARKYGFKFVEIVPYRWTTPQEIINLQKEYKIQVAGIHLPIWWNASLGQILLTKPGLLEKLFSCIFQIYLGKAAASPALEIARALGKQNPYVLLHSNVAVEIGSHLEKLTQEFHIIVENIPFEHGPSPVQWNPAVIQKTLGPRGIKGLVFDPGHFNQSLTEYPQIDLLETYRNAAPEVLHISYNSLFNHLLPNLREQAELKSLLRLHAPKYMVLETNPAVSISKGKNLLEKIMAEALG